MQLPCSGHGSLLPRSPDRNSPYEGDGSARQGLGRPPGRGRCCLWPTTQHGDTVAVAPVYELSTSKDHSKQQKPIVKERANVWLGVADVQVLAELPFASAVAFGVCQATHVARNRPLQPLLQQTKPEISIDLQHAS